MWEYVEEEEEEEKEEGCTRSDTATLTGIKNLLKQLERWLEIRRGSGPSKTLRLSIRVPPPSCLFFFNFYLHNITALNVHGVEHILLFSFGSLIEIILRLFTFVLFFNSFDK